MLFKEVYKITLTSIRGICLFLTERRGKNGLKWDFFLGVFHKKEGCPFDKYLGKLGLASTPTQVLDVYFTQCFRRRQSAFV
ncbi:MAG: hypothetical protein A2508_03360 [Candidatus Lambdaproteobacteria bacterium RIFOXYD12_FULL_49_8]|nr:MAG: hypothetical protein A2508_03360 [Candidatus Lambdaproteobacteria bacterium RIFOXYD12_FULL_49_8]